MGRSFTQENVAINAPANSTFLQTWFRILNWIRSPLK